MWETVTCIHHGDVQIAQENLMDAVVNVSPEFDIRKNVDSVPYLFQEFKMYRVTGVDKKTQRSVN